VNEYQFLNSNNFAACQVTLVVIAVRTAVRSIIKTDDYREYSNACKLNFIS